MSLIRLAKALNSWGVLGIKICAPKNHIGRPTRDLFYKVKFLANTAHEKARAGSSEQHAKRWAGSTGVLKKTGFLALLKLTHHCKNVTLP